jgi:hypothetical protein
MALFATTPSPVCVIKKVRCAIDVSIKSVRNLAGYNNSKTQAGYNITDLPFKSCKVSMDEKPTFKKY